MSHYGHEMDRTVDPIFCTDCQVPVTQFANKSGEMKSWERDPKAMKRLKGGKK
jgi:hypothetical protein